MSASGTPVPSCLTVLDSRKPKMVAHGCRTTIQSIRFLRTSDRTWPNEPRRPVHWNLIGRIFLTGVLLTTCPVSAQVHQWNVDGSGNWNQPSNWSPLGEPNSSDAAAKLGNVITGPQTIFVDNDITVNRIVIDSEKSYVLSGSSVLFDSITGNASIEVDRGSHEFQTPVDLLRDLKLDLALHSTLTFNNALNLNGRTLLKTRAGELQINSSQGGAGVVSATRGVVSGSGSIGGDLSNVSASVAPGPGFSQLSISGNYIQGPAATLEIEIGGATAPMSDVLNIAQTANLGGTLSLVVDSFVPRRGDQFGILNFSQRTGNFAAIQGLTLGPTLRLVPQYGPNDLTLTAAELVFWIGGDGEWINENNWQSGQVPDQTTLPVIDDEGTAQVLETVPPVAGLDILNGTVAIDLDGTMIVDGTTTIAAGGFLNVTSSLGPQPFLTRSMSVDGLINVVNGATATVFNELAVGKTGTVRVSPGSVVNVQGGLRNRDVATETLTDGIFNISGVLAFPNAHILTNRATLRLDGPEALIDDSLGGGSALNDLAKNAAGGRLNLIHHNLGVSGNFTNAGELTLDNSAFSAAATYVQTSGVTRLNGGTLAANLVDIRSGQLTGQGTVFGKVVNRADVVPSLDGAGILQIQGSYTQTAAGRLEIEIGGLEGGHDQLDVAGGPVQLGGLLELRLTGGFQPAFGQQFLVVRGGVMSPFNSFLFPNSLQGLAVDLIYEPSGVTVGFASPTDETYDSPPGGGLWSDDSSWLGEIPNSLDIVDLTNIVPGNAVLTVDIDAFVHQAVIGSLPSMTDTLTLAILAGQNWSATSDVRVGTNGNIQVDGGNFQAGGDVTIDGTGNARFIQMVDSNVNIGGDLRLATVEESGTYALAGGTLSMGGGAIRYGSSSALFDFSDGRLTDVRLISSDDPADANLVQLGGTLAPGNSPGTTEIEGDYTIMNAGTLEIEVEGITSGEFDELLVGGTATLDGTLDIQLEGNYDPSVGDMIVVLTASSISGEFSSVTTAMDDDTIMVPIYTRNSMFLCGSTVGDMDIDCDVDMDDIDEFVLALNDPIAYVLQEGYSGEALGDFDNDNDLDFDDVDGFAEALGGGMSVQQILNWVPEPGGFVMWGIAWLLWCASRTNRHGRRETTTNA